MHVSSCSIYSVIFPVRHFPVLQIPPLRFRPPFSRPTNSSHPFLRRTSACFHGAQQNSFISDHTREPTLYVDRDFFSLRTMVYSKPRHNSTILLHLDRVRLGLSTLKAGHRCAVSLRRENDNVKVKLTRWSLTSRCAGIFWPYHYRRQHIFIIIISQLPKLCVKISILRHRRMWVRSFSTRLTSVTFAEDKVLICLILRKNAKIVQLWV